MVGNVHIAQVTRKLLEINLAMLLISTSGAIGRYITIIPTTSIWVRSLFAAIVLIGYCLIKKFSFRIDRKADLVNIILSGVFLGLHWTLYFYSLQFTNVAIAMITLFTYPLFTSILEPLFYRTGWSVVQLIGSIVILFGLYVLMPSTDPTDTHFQGIMLGLGSSLAYTVRNLILKPQIERYNGSVLMACQLIIVTILMLPFQLTVSFVEIKNFLLPLIILAVVTTSMGHTLFLRSFRHFTLSHASILSSLQPIYGIVIALIFLNEIPDTNSIIGGLLILGTVV
ncbi:MAG: DMT family transporter, partial [Cyclobacteriaceae bacterium]